MTQDGPSPTGPVYMLPELTREELDEMRLAISMRSRMNGTGTKPHKLCVEILRKMDVAEREPHSNGKVAGVDSRAWKEY